MEQVVGRHVVGDVQVDPVVVIEIGRDDPQAAAVGVDETRPRGHVDEPAAVVAEDVIGERRESRAGCSRACWAIRDAMQRRGLLGS